MVTGNLLRGGGADYGLIGLSAGTITSPTMDVGGYFMQTGGTNNVLGLLRVGPSIYYSRQLFRLVNGTLNDQNAIISASMGGGLVQEGGVHRIAGDLTVEGHNSGSFLQGYVLRGGDLIVSNINLNQTASFVWTGGNLIQSGTLTLTRGHLEPGEGTHQFGRLKLAASGTDTNSSIRMPTDSAVVRFPNSSSVPWNTAATLTISNWNGSYLGGGSHRIIFGNSASALTPQQVARILFRDPGGGLSPGRHPTKILPTGEIVPDSVPPTGRIPPRLTIRKVPAGVEVTVRGEPGYDYGVLRSFYLTNNNWAFWDNRVATNGTMTLIDPELWPPQRFYKAVLMR